MTEEDRWVASMRSASCSAQNVINLYNVYGSEYHKYDIVEVLGEASDALSRALQQYPVALTWLLSEPVKAADLEDAETDLEAFGFISKLAADALHKLVSLDDATDLDLGFRTAVDLVAKVLHRAMVHHKREEYDECFDSMRNANTALTTARSRYVYVLAELLAGAQP